MLASRLQGGPSYKHTLPEGFELICSQWGAGFLYACDTLQILAFVLTVLEGARYTPKYRKLLPWFLLIELSALIVLYSLVTLCIVSTDNLGVGTAHLDHGVWKEGSSPYVEFLLNAKSAFHMIISSFLLAASFILLINTDRKRSHYKVSGSFSSIPLSHLVPQWRSNLVIGIDLVDVRLSNSACP